MFFFGRGQRQDEFDRLLPTLSSHPAAASAKDILQSVTLSSENSSFLGIATGTEKNFLGFGRRVSFLGFAAINLDYYNKTEDCLFDLYHITSQALDTFILIDKKVNFGTTDVILQPKRNQLALSRNNLKSDIFSALMMNKSGLEDSVKNLAEFRGKKALLPQTFYRPEDYPFVISADVINFSIRNLLNKKKDNLVSLFGLADKISVSFDKHNLRSWADFSHPAQNMAWNGFTEEEILGTAIYTSSDPFVKATGNLLSEITGIVPETLKGIPNASNPYIDTEMNSRHHDKQAEESFEMALIHAIEAESHLPLIRIANNQNEALLKGRMLGWCAHALQSAANTFEHSLKKGLAPAPASRIEFQRAISKFEWQSLETLNNHIVKQRRMGHAMTLPDIVSWCSSHFDLRPVITSLQMTMGQSDYALNLAHVNEAPKPLPRQLIVEPSMTPRISKPPSYAAQPAMGTMMGGGMMSAIAVQGQKKTSAAQDDAQ